MGSKGGAKELLGWQAVDLLKPRIGTDVEVLGQGFARLVMGLRIKLLLVWLVLLLAPLAILGGIGYVYIDRELRLNALDYQSDLVRLASSSANNYFARLRHSAAIAARSREVIALTTTGASSEPSLLTASAEQKLTALLDAYPEVQEYRLVRGDSFADALLRVSPSPGGLPSIDLSRLSPPSDSEIQIRHLPPSDGHDGYVVTMAPIVDTGTRTRYYLLSTTPLDSLSEMVAPTPERDARLFVVDNKGRVVTRRPGLNITQLSAADSLFSGSGNSRTLPDYRFNGTSYLLSMNRIDDGLWLVSLTDNALLFAKKLPYIIVFVTALSLTLVMSGVVFNLIVNNIAIKPIQKLIQATRQIAKGDLEPVLDVRGKDELGELALSFRQMGKQLLHTSRRIRQLAYFDPLTQLPNRTTLRETLSRLLARSDRGKWKTAVLFIDLDDFKKVNDRLGHEAGDELLIQISHRLKNRLRLADILFEQAGVASVDQLISRRGGDEFNAILTNIKAPHDAAAVAERIIQDLNEPFLVSKSEIHVGASVGVALFPDDGNDADTLLRNADLAMYEAKAKGKNNYHIFTSAINEQVHHRLALESSLQAAMVHSQFRLYYQPKVSLADMSPVGFEALVRWKHPEKGIILPSKFIPVAEESNLIRDIGNWVLAECMQQVQLWEDVMPKHLRIAINISARQLAQSDLVEQLRMMMDHFSISPERLEIELTETSVLQDEVMASQHLSALRALGVEVSLDDFGTGYSSLSFLRKLPIDTVKIDRSFTANVIQNAEARAIVISLLGLCKQLKVKTIAEGIETTEQLQFLMEHGCDQGQGFLFSKPLPSHEVLTFLEDPSYLALS